MPDIVAETRLAVGHLTRELNSSEFAEVETSRGLRAIIDPQFYNDVMQHRWFAVISKQEHIYAVADIQAKRVTLGRYIYSLAFGEAVKHVAFKNKVSFDCRVSNLVNRVGRQSVMRNRKPKRGTTSRFKGVRVRINANGGKKWAAQIKSDDGNIHLGTFAEEKRAAEIYDAAAFRLFDGAAFYNFPNVEPTAAALAEADLRIMSFRAKKARKVSE